MNAKSKVYVIAALANATIASVIFISACIDGDRNVIDNAMFYCLIPIIAMFIYFGCAASACTGDKVNNDNKLL